MIVSNYDKIYKKEVFMKLNTHLKIDTSLSGEIIKLDKGYAKVALKTTDMMRVDEEGLVHGGFCFCAADFAVMASINDPFVVLSKSEVKFLAPVRVGEVVIFEANVSKEDGRWFKVHVVGKVNEKDIFDGLFDAVILKEHVLNR
jgi:acyl-coenzyme A thioesterase PaaI-like protein